MTVTLDDLAQAAICRLDDGEGRPGDERLAREYDVRLRASDDARWQAIEAAEHERWLAGQCGGCVDGGTGETCDEHEEDR